MSRVIIVHGIHSHGGSEKAEVEGIDRFGQALKDLGHEVVEFEYPKRWALQLYWPGLARDDGRALANTMRDGDHVVAHSYGCLVWQMSILAGAKWGKCFLFGGAATSDKFFYPDFSLVEAHVVYNPEDRALMFGALLPFHPFGKLGLRGYFGQPGRAGRDYRFINVPALETGAGLNHSHYWGADMPRWIEYVGRHLSCQD